MTNDNRTRAGVPTGGEFTAHQRTEGAALLTSLVDQIDAVAAREGWAPSDWERHYISLAAAGEIRNENCPDCGQKLGEDGTDDGICRPCAFPTEYSRCGQCGEVTTNDETCEDCHSDDSQRCDLCGETMTVDITTRVSQHLTADGRTDYNLDGDHVAYTTENNQESA